MTQAFNLSQLANFVNSSGQLDASTGLTNTTSLGFPTGTLMLFQQTTAPTGWTKQTTHNDKALRVVSGTAGSGGSVAFTTAFASQTPSGSVTLSGLSAGATTLSTAQMPSHDHTLSYCAPGYASGTNNSSAYEYGVANTARYGTPTANAAGSGGSHTHSVSGSASFTGNAINLSVQYVDLIIASKN